MGDTCVAQFGQYGYATGPSQVTQDMGANDHSARAGRLLAVADIPDGGARETEAVVGGIAESLILVREGARTTAFLNICPHAGHRLDWSPGQFLIDQGRLVCAVHGACFERSTGLCVSGPCRGSSLRKVAVVESEGWVLLDP
jgi:nitrite reductase/ring-hydroxylating ferredoxin subunit